MASERTGWRRAKLMLPVLLWVLLGGSACTRDTEADRRLEKLDSYVSKGGHVVVKARLLRFDSLFEQEETDFVDLSAKSDLIIALLLPARTSDLSNDYQEICQIQVAENKEATPIVFHIRWLGDGPPLYTVDGFSTTYKREKPPPPELRRDQHIDEAVVLCGFIRATIAGDDARRSSCEEALRVSAGLKQPKE